MKQSFLNLWLFAGQKFASVNARRLAEVDRKIHMGFFTRKEFTCKCGCGFNAVDFEFLLMLVDIRRHFRKPVKIHSGCRCITHNKVWNGADNSYHLKGQAGDIEVLGVRSIDVYNYLCKKYPNTYGFKTINNERVHADIRKVKWRAKYNDRN